VAETGDGVEILLDNILEHKNYLFSSGDFESKRVQRKATHVKEIIKDRLTRRVENQLSGNIKISDKGTDPYTLAEELINRL
jgi:LAO/AO transport system kinase